MTLLAVPCGADCLDVFDDVDACKADLDWDEALKEVLTTIATEVQSEAAAA